MIQNLKHSLAAAITLSVLLNVSAKAADTDGAVGSSARDWSGFYAGIALDGAGGGADFDTIGKKGDLDIRKKGYGASVLAGYNFTSSGWMLGVETDMTLIDISTRSAVSGLGTVTQDADWLGSVGLRAGYAWDSVMIYGAGGAAFSDFAVTSSLGGKSDNLNVGLVVGAGAELAIDENWSARGEMLGYVFDGKAVFGGNRQNFDAGFGLVRVGVTRKF